MLTAVHEKTNGRCAAQSVSGYRNFDGKFSGGSAGLDVVEDKTLGMQLTRAVGVGEMNKTRPHLAAGNARVLDLCCGMGGLSVAAREMGMRVVAGVDLNPSALRTFGRNFPQAEAIEGSVQSRTVLERCRPVEACDE